MKYTRLLSMMLMSAACGLADAQPMVDQIPTDNRKVPGLEVFVEHAEIIKPFARTETGRAFLDAVATLPNQLRRYLWVDRPFMTAYTEAEYATLDEKQKKGLNFRPVTELAYYMAVSERPLLDVLALDLVVSGTQMASPEGLAGKKVLLYNPRVITQGRLLASLGADVTIVQDQQRFSALYSEPGDVGAVDGFGELPAGKLRVVRSNWPGEGSPVPGSGYDLILASDWISKGLSTITAQPPRWITPGASLHPLPCEREAFVDAIAGALAPGGRFINYAYGPIQPRQPSNTLPYSDVRLPFSTEMIQNAGLEILAFDADDTHSFLTASIATGYNEPLVRPNDGMPSMTTAYAILQKPAASE